LKTKYGKKENETQSVVIKQFMLIFELTNMTMPFPLKSISLFVLTNYLLLNMTTIVQLGIKDEN
jgi:hypothetical protein